jgi:hypothetical protein
MKENKDTNVIRFDLEGQTELSGKSLKWIEEIRRDENGEIIAYVLKRLISRLHIGLFSPL